MRYITVTIPDHTYTQAVSGRHSAQTAMIFRCILPVKLWSHTEQAWNQ
jgi:hypothetical protein